MGKEKSERGMGFFSLSGFSLLKKAIGQFGFLWHNVPSQKEGVQLYPKVERENVKGLSRWPLCQVRPQPELQSQRAVGRSDRDCVQ